MQNLLAGLLASLIALSASLFGIVNHNPNQNLAAVGAPSTISLIAHTQSSSGASSAINTTGATLIVIQELRYGLAPTAPTDSAGNTWTALSDHSDGTSDHVRYYYMCGPTTSSTHTFTPGVGSWASVAAFSGTATSNCFDSGTEQSGKTPNGGIGALPAITPSQSGDLIVSGIAENTFAADGPTVNQGLAIAETKASNPAAAFAWTQYNSVSPLTVSWTIHTSPDAQMIIAAFKAADSGSTPTPAPGSTPSTGSGQATPTPTPTPATPVNYQLGWNDLGAGSKLSLSSPQSCNNTSSPAYCNGVIYDYAGHFASIMGAWGNAIARTKAGSEQMVFFGGGHNDYLGNDIHTINLYTNPVTVSALTTPSIPRASAFPATASNIQCQTPNLDGTPMTQHGYQNFTYFPKHDEMFFWAQGQSDWCLSNWSGTDRLAWTFRFSDNTWHNMVPSGFNVQAGNDGTFASYVVLDPTTQDETALVAWGMGGLGELLRYDRDTNVWTQLMPYGSYVWPTGGYAAIDPVRKLLVILGAARYDGTGGLKAITVNIANSSYQFTDISSTLSGCSAANVLSPGMVYDPNTGNFKVYPGSGNSVLDFNPATGVCTTQTLSGGPTDSLPGAGQFGKWQYFPTLNAFVNATQVNSDAFMLKASTGSVTSQPSPTPTPSSTPTPTPPSAGANLNGLGGSTITCLDKDGDGYGTGPGCQGPDADDNDAAVHTGPQAISKWGSLNTFLAHRGYNPTHIWYMAPATPSSACLANGGAAQQCTGNDTTGVVDDINHPFLTAAPVRINAKAGQMIMFRDGWSDRFDAANGTAGQPVILMGYPGEQPLLSTTANPSSTLVAQGHYWIVIDGFRMNGSACMGGGDFTGSDNPHSSHDNIFRHIEGYNCYRGFISSGIQNYTLEDSVFHDNSEAGVYWGSGCVPSSGAIIRRVISYNNSYSGIHLNGLNTNTLIEQTITYGNGIEGIALQSGNNNSIFRNNLSFLNNGAIFEFYNYKNDSGGVGCDGLLHNITAATWSNGIATITIGSHGKKAGQSMYVGNVTPSGYNCGGVGCLVTGVTATTVSYVLPSDPGTYVSGGFEESGVGDQSGNIIENNTFFQGTKDPLGAPTRQPSAIWVASTNPDGSNNPATGDLGHNMYRNNILVNDGDLSTVWRYTPIGFRAGNANATMSFVASSIFDHNLTYQANKINGGIESVGLFNQTCNPACNGEAVYGTNGQPLNGGPALAMTTGSFTGNIAADPKFISASSNFWNSLSSFNFSPQPSSPAVHTGASVGAPIYDILGNTFNNPPSIGAYEYSGSAPVTPPVILPQPPVLDTTPPTISNLLGSLTTTNSTNITWTTNELSDTQVEYGITSVYGKSSILNSSLLTSHSVTLSNLSPNTLYHFRVKSRDSAGNLSTTADFSFTTLAVTVTPPSLDSGSPPAAPTPAPATLPPAQTVYIPATASSASSASPLANSFTFTSDIEKNSRGTLVSQLQKTLSSLGYLTPDSITGYYGPLTEQAIKRFQSTYNISPTGTLGPLTRIKLNTLQANPPTVQGQANGVATITLRLQRNSKGLEVSTLQTILVKESLLTPDSITGYFGPLTEQAVKSFQKKYNIVTSGTPSTTGYGAVGPKTRKAIEEIRLSPTQ